MVETLPTIGILGLGAMGSRMAKRLVDAGYKVQAWNRSPAPLKLAEQWGVASQPSALNAVEGADIVLSMLRDDQAARQVWLDPDRGAIQAVMPNMIILESSTISEDWVKTLGRDGGTEGHLLDAPLPVRDRKLKRTIDLYGRWKIRNFREGCTDFKHCGQSSRRRFGSGRTI